MLVVSVCALGSAEAQVEITDVTVCNVTTSQFTVVWRTSAASVPRLDLFSDAAGTTSLAGIARVEFSPLGLGDVATGSTSTFAAREARRALASLIAGRLLVVARVSGLPENATVYARPRTFGAGGADNGTGLLPVSIVNLAAQTSFVADAQVLAIDFSGAGATGMAAILQGPAGTVPLASIVGDASDPDVAWFNLADIIALALDTNAAFGAPVEFSVRLLGLDAPSTVLTHTVTFQAGTVVAGYSTTPFGGAATPAFFVFDPIATQSAGLGFTVTVRAMQSNGQPLTTFAGTATLSSSGAVAVGAGETTAFAAGVLPNHPVRIDQPGAFALTATRATSTGTSNVFAVNETFGSWWMANFTPAQQADPNISGIGADPDGAGITNLLRYAFSTGITNPNRTRLPVLGTVADAGALYLTISFERLTYAAGILYRVEGSNDLQAWSLVQAVNPGLPAAITVRDTVPLASVARRFLRVTVVQQPTFANYLNLNTSAADRSNPVVLDGSADPGGRGVTVLERYAYGLDYANPDLTRLPAVQTIHVGGQDFLTITFRRLPPGGEVRYLVQSSVAPSVWTTFQTVLPGTPELVTIQDTAPVGGASRFLRVVVERAAAP